MRLTYDEAMAMTDSETEALSIAVGEARQGRWDFRNARWSKRPEPQLVKSVLVEIKGEGGSDAPNDRPRRSRTR